MENVNKIKLSILICNLFSRNELLCRLLKILELQKTDAVEILIASDNGEISIGKKRNTLLDKATGEYISFVDDDDLVSENYVSSILNAIESYNHPDCIGICGIYKGFTGDELFYHSIRYAGWYNSPDGYFRPPNHLNPIKTAIARKIRFIDRSFGEDRIYSDRIRPLLKTEGAIDHPIYTYIQRTA
jgi:glycosyltransferase involved in cell wall biosynthesis